MLFNSLEFLIFLPLVFILYWFVFKNQKQQNILLLLSSYVFYGWWDWRFLFLVLFSTIIDYFIGKKLSETVNTLQRKLLLSISVSVNIGLLGFFKYYNFFVDSWIEAWNNMGITMHASSMQIVLPVGISFYTFQTLSYTIDVYRKQIKPCNDFIVFSGFVSFFPQLVAGPIERASNLLPQFLKKREFNYNNAVTGMKLILWGLVKKVVIADSCAVLVNKIFSNYQHESGLALCMGAIYFGFQIYGDFSGYSDIAIGTSRLFGFRLMKNFNYPYFSRDIAEFWRRWHISLTTWFRDYVYIPLGGARGTKYQHLRNVLVIFIVSGFWHGANWTFVFWGLINAIFFIPLLLTKTNNKNKDQVALYRNLPTIMEVVQMLFTFLLVTFTWVFFRSESISEAFEFIHRIFMFDNFIPPTIKHKKVLPIIFSFVVLEWFSRKQEYPIILDKKLRGFFYVLFAFLVVYYSAVGASTSFIYFQF